MTNLIVLLLAASLVCGIPLVAQPGPRLPIVQPPAKTKQTPPIGDSPGVGSSTLYRAFFSYHDRLSTMIESRTVAKPEEGSQLVRDTAKLHGIQEDEHSKAAAISHAVVAQVKGIDNEANTHVQRQKGLNLPPDGTLLQLFEDRRARAVTDGMMQLRSTLRPESWRGLQNYINLQHRVQIHRVAAVKTSQR